MTTQFTPWAALFGGGLIGLAAVLLMAFNGRIAGISDILNRLLPPYAGDGLPVRAAFTVGLLVAAPVCVVLSGKPIAQAVSANLGLMAFAGLLVGFGAVFGSGCTSGHGVCGLSRLSARSLVATMTFMGAAFVTVLLMRHTVGG